MLTRWYPLLRRILPRGFRHFLRYPTSGVKGWWWELRFRLAGPVVLEVSEGWTVRVHPATEAMFRGHRDEPEYRQELARFAAICTQGMTLIDVGANYGVFTLAALHYGGPASTVIAIDPSPTAQRYLAINLALNDVVSRVEQRVEALTDQSRQIALLPTGSGQAHMMMRGVAGRPDTTTVAALTLDDVADAAGRPITHVKIDVEGFEGQVLRGGRTMIEQQQPLVTLELHNWMLRDLGDSPDEVTAVLQAAGYQATDLAGQPISWHAATLPPIARLTCLPSSSR
jgi:FkbM family methyltransferase